MLHIERKVGEAIRINDDIELKKGAKIMFKKSICALLAASSLIGCAAPQKYTLEDMQDPATTPVEKWSDAMTYMHAMGITGMRDIPKSIAIEEGFMPSGYTGASANAIDVGVVGLSAVSPPSGFSGGAAVGVGLGLMLLGGGASPMWQMTHIAAWVPSSMADSPEEAVQVVEREYTKARKAVFKKGLSNEKMLIAKYPHNHPSLYGGKMASEGNIVKFDSSKAASPSFLNSAESYGPIFILRPNMRVDASKNSMNYRDALKAVSSELPDWFFIHNPRVKLRKNPLPAVVYRGGQENYFIGK